MHVSNPTENSYEQVSRDIIRLCRYHAPDLCEASLHGVFLVILCGHSFVRLAGTFYQSESVVFVALERYGIAHVLGISITAPPLTSLSAAVALWCSHYESDVVSLRKSGAFWNANYPPWAVSIGCT